MTTRINKLNLNLQIGCAAAILLFIGGCSYYNTFYNIKKEFRAAEKQTARTEVAQPIGEPTRPGQPPTGSIPVQQYQGILQSCAKLLEYYPKSRWIDDALMIMGISYYRTEEFARAERKFTELLTIFPNSKHVEMSIVWRARSLLAQEKFDEAEAVLTAAENRLATPEAKAAAGRTLAGIYDKRNQPDEAVKYLEQIQNISYDSDDKASDYLTLGRSYLLLGRKDEAREALQRCLGTTRKPNEAFDSRQLLAEMAANDGDYVGARMILRPLETDRRFLDRIGDVQVELARVEAVAGDPLVCIQMLEDFCSKAPQGEAKAQAYFLQGIVARDKLKQLDLAKAKLDSAIGAGASRELQDSASFASKQLESGLTALQRIPELETNIKKLQDEITQAELLEASIPTQIEEPEPTEISIPDSSVDTVGVHDTLAVSVIERAPDLASDSLLLIGTDTLLISKTDVDSNLTLDTLTSQAFDSLDGLDLKVDTTVQAPLEELAVEMTPAEMIADSIMRAIAAQDSAKKASKALPDSQFVAADDTSKDVLPEVKRQSEVEILKTRLASITIQLVNAHIEAASFYSLVLHQPDSAFAHVERAVAAPDSSEDHWRATVQLGLELLREGRDAERGRSELQRVANSESAPYAVRNAAYEALGLPKLEIAKTEQELALEHVEQSLLQNASYEELLQGYYAVVNMDSTTLAGSRALLAIAYLQEYKLNDFEGAIVTHKEITRLFPDSTFAETSMAKLQPPDTNSIFLMSEEALQATMQPALELLSTDSDSLGWPPEEESLRGRRFK